MAVGNKVGQGGRRGWAALGVALALGLCTPPVQAAETAVPSKRTVLLVMMPGKPTVHIIEMPSMERCRDAAEHTPSAICVETSKPGREIDPDVLKEFAPAAGPTASRDGPPPSVTYKPLN